MINFYVKNDVLEACVKIVFAVMEGIDNSKVSDEWIEHRERRHINH